MTRNRIVLLIGVIVIIAANSVIAKREALITAGRTIFLELAPRDPRSIMQGDYMALRFRITEILEDKPTASGKMIVKLDEQGIARAARVAGGPPAADEALLEYRIRRGRARISTDAFFFQEGHAKRYEPARYGEFRVAPDGQAILVDLRGAKLERLSAVEVTR